jgi:hypothetical protein
MVLLFHIAIALASVAFSTYLYFRPTNAKFYTAYGMVGLTVLSGSYLIITTGTNILKTCLTGLAYIGAVSFVLAAARKKFASEKTLKD